MAEPSMEDTKKDLLKGYLTHVPPNVNDGSFDLSVRFKKDVADSRRVYNKRNVTLSELNSAINKLHSYWT